MNGRQLDFITNEPVEGELLSDRLAAGPLAAEDALRCAVEIGALLSEAHTLGRVHGTLSPHSIAITAHGARLLTAPSAPSEDSAAYRSPEQVRGEAPDSRSDIFAFGAVVYELATAERAFGGSGAELSRRILEDTPAAPHPIPAAYAAMEPVIDACLRKDRSARRQRVKNAVTELKLRSRLVRGPRPQPAISKRATRRWFQSKAAAWTAAVSLATIALALILLAIFLFVLPLPGSAPAGGASYTFRLDAPRNTTDGGAPAISPDGSYLVYAASDSQGPRRLWLRALDALTSVPIAGTEDASSPFWSPDSRHIAFFAEGRLKRVSLEGGTPQIICAAGPLAAGGTWNTDDTILFAPVLGGGIYRVSAKAIANRHPELFMKPEPADSEIAFRWPRFLPDQKHFLFFAKSDSPASTGVYVGSLESREYRRLLAADTNAIFSAGAGSRKTGYLLFMDGRDLMSQPFDASRQVLTDAPALLLEDLGAFESIHLAPVGASENGILVYQSVARTGRRLAWLDHSGAIIAAVKEPGQWGTPRLSPDGNRALVAKLEPDGKNASLWLVDAQTNTARVTDLATHQGSPVWSPDGKRAAFFQSAQGTGNSDVYTKIVDSPAKPSLLFRSEFPNIPTDWSRDGRYLLFTVLNPATKADVWALSLREGRTGPILATVFNESYAALSPDGKWLAFQSDEAGKPKVYVERFDGLDWSTRRHYRVSTDTGGLPRWRGDGKELFFVTVSGKLMAASVHPSSNDFEFDPPKSLFQMPAVPSTWNFYDASPDGQRFLVNLPVELTRSDSITAVVNWTAKRKRITSEQRH